MNENRNKISMERQSKQKLSVISEKSNSNNSEIIAENSIDIDYK